MKVLPLDFFFFDCSSVGPLDGVWLHLAGVPLSAFGVSLPSALLKQSTWGGEGGGVESVGDLTSRDAL